MEFIVQYVDGEPTFVTTEEVGEVTFVIEDDGLTLVSYGPKVTTMQIEKVAQATKELPFVDDVVVENARLHT